jgi:uncharacterized protein DUF6526
MPDQDYATHRRYHPLFHFFAIPVLTINLLLSIYIAIRHPVLLAFWNALVAAALLATCFLTRIYGLRNQDRLIRLEERVRLATLLPPDLRGRIGELSMGNLIGLRFCGDDEVADVTRAVLNGELKGRDEIKKRVQNWRADHHRL